MFTPVSPDEVDVSPPGPLARGLARLDQTLFAARAALFPLAPVAMGLGVGAYFALPEEPPRWVLAGLAVMVALAVLLALRASVSGRVLALAVALACGGALMAGLRTHSVAAPVMGWQRYGPVEGRLVSVDRSGSDRIRLTLDQVVLPGVSPERVPGRVRISVHGDLDIEPVAGMRVMMTAHLGPPPGPVEPGGFDYRRLAWFDGLGALGYTRSPVLALEDPEPGLALVLTRLRLSIAQGIRDRLPGEAGGFVAAILTGDRSGISLETTENLRDSNLYHMVSISGMHMAMLTAVVYGGLRALLALFPVLALTLPIRKVAAGAALAAALAYLALSGGDVATQRAFIMAAAMLGAVLVDRRVFSLRTVALAALILLVWRPESLLSAGFQMSFAATIALVAVFQALADRRRGRAPPRQRGWRRLQGPVGGTLLSSLVAGMATAPFAAALFNRFAGYGLLANGLTVPVMGLVIMPAGVLAAVLWLVGLEGPALRVAGLGTQWILFVGEWVAGLEGAVQRVRSPPDWVIPLLSLGALWLILWPGRLRWAGTGALALALAGWGLASRPALLIDREGALVGLMTADGRALSRARGAGFTAEAWLEADGDSATQAEAAARAGFVPVPGGVRWVFDGRDWLHLTGARGAEALPGHCRDGVTIVTDRPVSEAPQGCRILDPPALRATGALALARDGTLLTAADSAGARPWSR